jgi:hypothetical protein|tara:strand:- start:750 stop:1232 length:483 start_codon:yes stop_codon:yes gene_type:complete
MANKDLYGNNYTVPNDVVSGINNEISRNKNNKSLKGYKRAQNIVGDKTMTYSMLKRVKNFFDGFSGGKNTPEYLINGGEKMKTWVNNTLKQSRGDINRQKTVKSDSGMKNQFKKTHTKDKENKNVTKVNVARPQNTARQIFTNKTVYKEMINTINKILKN